MSFAAALSGAEGPGLVLVPTSHTRGFDPSQMAEIAAGEDAIREALGAFELNAVKTRLAKLRMAVGFAARCHAVSEKGSRTDVPVMVTLTYAGDNRDWQPDHMSKFMNRARMWLTRQGVSCRYVWVAELQKRGVIHYHAVFWLPVGVRMPRPDAAGWWPHGMTRIEVARHAVGYLMKYLSKDTSKASETVGSFPKGSRAYGVGGLDFSLRRARRWLRLPAFVQANSSIFDDWKRKVGGGWLAPCGRWLCSEFERVRVGRAWVLRRVALHERSIEASGPFCWLGDRAKALSLMH